MWLLFSAHLQCLYLQIFNALSGLDEKWNKPIICQYFCIFSFLILDLEILGLNWDKGNDSYFETNIGRLAWKQAYRKWLNQHLLLIFFSDVQLSYNLSKAIRTELINIFTPDAQVQNKKWGKKNYDCDKLKHFSFFVNHKRISDFTHGLV